ncbi:MAG TPA: EAL domain-containing protein [Sphingomicrobium sp.]|nr:EAL domain-containing protein [Sphingomicrobium sp.]
MIATIAAIVEREPLTRRAVEFGPGGEGERFYAYGYADGSNGGASSVAVSSRDPLSWRCVLRPSAAWPYCGFGLLFDKQHSGKGLDLSRYKAVGIRIDYAGAGKFIRLSLKNGGSGKSPFSNKSEQVTVPVHRGVQFLNVDLREFAVPDWWKDQAHASGDLARPSFNNIIALEIISGADGVPGPQEFRIRSITFQRQLLSVAAFYGTMVGLWAALIAGMLQHKRRQLRLVRRSAQEALRASEQLHRGILEATTDMIVLLSPQGDVELVNGPGLNAMEVETAEQVQGKHWTRLWRDPSAVLVQKALEQAAAGKTARFRAYCATSKGTPKWWDVVAAPMHRSDGSLKGLLTISRDVSEEREKSERLKWASEHDALTDLPNRAAFQSRLQAAVLRAMETGKKLGLLLIDLDHFKHVNDSLGHSSGDELLQCIAERLRNCLPETCFIARIGGDEFALIVETVADEAAMVSTGEEALSIIQRMIRTAGRAIRPSASIGGAIFPLHAATANDLFKNADLALYSRKQEGRGGTRLFDQYMREESQKVASQLRLARGALTNRTVVPYYQPKISVVHGSICGFEALLRWRHPTKGLQLPAALEQAFGDYELAAKIGQLMQRKVAADIRNWSDCGIDIGRVAINAAPAEFLRDDYAEQLLSLIAEQEVSPRQIEVEITEHAFLGRANEYVARALGVLKNAGVKIALDDFGTGSSSLSHLRDFPVDVVKIDMSFVQQMAANDEIAAIVTAVVRLAQSLAIQSVAEGVDHPSQMDLLRVIGCDLAQGHLFAAAVDASTVTKMLRSKKEAA